MNKKPFNLKLAIFLIARINHTFTITLYLSFAVFVLFSEYAKHSFIIMFISVLVCLVTPNKEELAQLMNDE
jgi:hypothetical protein